MIKYLSSIIIICLTLPAASQVSVGIGVNYTRFKSYDELSTPGIQSRIVYENGPYSIGLNYNYHIPIKTDNQGGVFDTSTRSWSSVKTQIKIRFQVFDVFIQRTILGSQQTKGQFYGGLGGSFVLFSFTERFMEPFTGNPFPLVEGSRHGFTLNGMLGSSYKLGRASLYSEVSYSIPKKIWSIKDSYTTSPYRYGLLLGIKISLKQ